MRQGLRHSLPDAGCRCQVREAQKSYPQVFSCVWNRHITTGWGRGKAMYYSSRCLAIRIGEKPNCFRNAVMKFATWS